MKNLNPGDIAAKWANRVSGAGSEYSKGISGVQVSPGALAAAQKNVYVANVQASADKWAANVGAVSLASWKNSTLTFGVNRYTSGSAKGKPKMQAFMTAAAPFLMSVHASLPPRGNQAANQQRYQQMQSAWQTFKYTKPTL